MRESIDELKKKTIEIKRKCLDMCINAGAGHITSAFSCADIVVALYYNIMNLTREDGELRDRFIMSKNHGSIITYPILEDLGYLEKGETETFLRNGSKLGTHSKISVPGVDFAGGSLGIGLGVAAGMAYSAKVNREPWNVYTIIGDGECYEGSIWESAMFAGFQQLNNLVVFLDRNNLCVTDYTEEMLAFGDMSDKWRSFGWNVKTIDGHNMEEIIDSVKDIPAKRQQRPLCVLCNTVKGNGIDFMSNRLLLHGVTPKGQWADLAREQLQKEADAYGA